MKHKKLNVETTKIENVWKMLLTIPEWEKANADDYDAFPVNAVKVSHVA